MFKKFVLLVLTSLLVASLISCSKDKEATKTADKSEVSTAKELSTKGKERAEKTPKSEAQLASELVLKNTKLVKVFSINQQISENDKELGPFYLVRGVDEKGRKTEVWVNKGKIYYIK
ncbi:hypothetical protein QE429_000995 [Bacillus sp. SORGH_AS 510]|uniref:hypothetical protein n=1 Tax=Bacillus sp. SORGH_AS_0510 TaxID=3041771 RepID=UPI002788BA74|nr:hypothetical protein [Bacillus sp. SORGH_AS_0510]MDQ1144168.1 hypothetical protein [Bacillus sp. SORGH_AS_0510]